MCFPGQYHQITQLEVQIQDVFISAYMRTLSDLDSQCGQYVDHWQAVEGELDGMTDCST